MSFGDAEAPAVLVLAEPRGHPRDQAARLIKGAVMKFCPF